MHAFIAACPRWYRSLEMRHLTLSRGVKKGFPETFRNRSFLLQGQCKSVLFKGIFSHSPIPSPFLFSFLPYLPSFNKYLLSLKWIIWETFEIEYMALLSHSWYLSQIGEYIWESEWVFFLKIWNLCKWSFQIKCRTFSSTYISG